MALFKVFSKLSLPKLGLISIESVPPDSEEVRTFLANSFSDISELCFTNETVIEASKYIEALKIAATKNVEAFGVYNTRFSQKEFEGLVSSAKGIKCLSLRCNIIEMDEPADFGNMEGSCVETIILDTCGEENYSNWRDNPIRFGNLLAGIANCDGLKKSLKKLSILNCQISKEEAQDALSKYGLNDIKLLV